MRHAMWVVLVMLTMAAGARGQAQPTVVVPAAGKANYVAVGEQMVLNVNAVAGINYASSVPAGTGTLTITYLNGYTGSYSVKLTPDEWKAVQGQIVSAGNK